MPVSLLLSKSINQNSFELNINSELLSCSSFLHIVKRYAGTADGASTTGKLFSIVQTARANGLKVEPYLKYLISNINKEPLDKLLPWSNNLPEDLKITSKDIYK